MTGQELESLLDDQDTWLAILLAEDIAELEAEDAAAVSVIN